MVTYKKYRGVSVTYNTNEMHTTHIIYRLTFPNGKVYIGQTKQELRKRISSHCYNSFNENNADYTSVKSCAIRKYLSFKVDVIGKGDNLDDLEIALISKYNSIELGYNTQNGGTLYFDRLNPTEFKKFKINLTEIHNNLSLEAKKSIRFIKPFASYYIVYLNSLDEDFDLNAFFNSDIFIIEDEVEKLSFREQCEKYYALKSGKTLFKPDFPRMVIEAVNKLGIEKLEELNYHKGNVSNALIGMLDTSDEIKVAKMMRLRRLEFYSSEYLKDKFQEIYDRVGINATAKATDIKRYYEVKANVKRVDGVLTRGFIIMLPKIRVSK